MAKSEDGRKLLETGQVKFVKGDGRLGYKDDAAYSAIHVGACADAINQTLIDQLSAPGRMFIPVQDNYQQQYIWVIDKQEDGSVEKLKQYGVSYVPLTDAPDA